MRNVIFARSIYGKLLLNLLQHTRIQAGVDDESFDFVYSSHCLEHMYDVQTSLKNWFRVVRKSGYLILAIPHRNLYEKIKAALTDYDVKYIKACDEGHTITDPLVHSDGEYQIEIVIQKV